MNCGLFLNVRRSALKETLTCLNCLTFQLEFFKDVFISLFTSMFVERMEVLEYRQKFEFELSTFPDSTNTETPRKLLVFSLTSVCLSVCEKVCQWISYEIVDRFG